MQFELQVQLELDVQLALKFSLNFKVFQTLKWVLGTIIFAIECRIPMLWSNSWRDDEKISSCILSSSSKTQNSWETFLLLNGFSLCTHPICTAMQILANAINIYWKQTSRVLCFRINFASRWRRSLTNLKQIYLRVHRKKFLILGSKLVPKLPKYRMTYFSDLFLQSRKKCQSTKLSTFRSENYEHGRSIKIGIIFCKKRVLFFDCSGTWKFLK